MTTPDPLMAAALRALEGREWYTFDELSDAGQKHAVRAYVDNTQVELSTDYEEEILTELGVADASISWSGFGSQGDGASFIGSYAYSRVVNNVGKYPAGALAELRPLYKQLIALQRRHQWRLCANIERRTSRYYHEHTVDIDVYRTDDKDVPEDVATELGDILRGFMRWVYRSLEKEWDYQTGEGAVEYLRNCDDRYDEQGHLL